MVKRGMLILLSVVIAVLTVAIGARGYTPPGVPSPVIATGTGPRLCFPGTEPRTPPGPYRAYLPLILCARKPVPPTCAPEIEPNATHTDAQVVTDRCVEGHTSWSGDLDWYRLDICSPVDLFLVLAGPTGVDLDLYLHGDPPGWPLYSSEGVGTSRETITATGLVSGTYYVLVQPWGQADYELSIRANLTG
jgi:hypothetical protein